MGRWNNNMKHLISGLLLLCAVLPLAAGNSIFSYDGFPVRYYGTDIYSISMGDAGSSDAFRYNSGYANPALHNSSNRTILATGLVFGYTSYRSEAPDGSRESYLDDALDLPYFSLSIPIAKHRVGFQFSSFASGSVKNQTTFTDDAGNEVTEKQEMDRYIYRGDLIYSYLMGKYSVGISGNYYFGHDIRSLEQDGSYDPYNTTEELAHSYKNPGITLGGMAQYDRLSLGAYYRMGTTLKGSTTRTTLHSTEDEDGYEYQLPHEFCVSATALPFEEHKVSADVHYETWNAIDAARYDDSWKISVGWAYEPKAEKHDSYWGKMPLRGGISLRRLPFLADGENVSELGLAVGVSFPLKRDINRIDLGFQYLRRGNLSHNRLMDNSFMLMLGFTGFDIIGKGTDRTAPRDIPEKEEQEAW